MPFISIIVPSQPGLPQRPRPESRTGLEWERAGVILGLSDLRIAWNLSKVFSGMIAGTSTSIHSSRGRFVLVRLSFVL
ncbi:hypothetical protein A3748_13090 [Erythrobacter sp. HI0077]|nr:hypothetical protein A3745_06735 [Erythrobacter sp. HI0074]KZZ07931.1 hypothetical protein A3748_13090 [Erythrobacter sp. HI0077]